MELIKNTFFINLEERKDRLGHVKSELKKLNIEGERFNAVKTASGAIGCSLSHIKCLELAKERGYEQVFICEDDITFLKPELLMENLKRFNDLFSTKPLLKNQWDVLIIGGNNCPPYEKMSEFCIRIYNCQTTTGYIVKQHYYDILIQNMKDGVKQLLKNPENKREFALDMYWKQLQQKNNWFMLIPPSVIQYENYSDIEKNTMDYKHLMLDLDKEWIFGGKREPSIPKFHQMTYFNSKV